MADISAPEPKKKSAKERRVDADRIAEAVDYRLQGHAYPLIAEQMKLPIKETIRLVHEGLTSLVRESSSQQLLLELQRVDQMMAAVYPTATNGDNEAIRTVLALRQERERLEMKLERQESFAALAPTEDEDGSPQ